MLTIGSKVPSIEVDEGPIIFNALTNNPMEIIVEIKEIPIIDTIDKVLTGK
jgi:hypothetical protein